MALDWAAFYVQHRRALVTYAIALTGDSAAAYDLLHDVLLRLMQEISQPEKPRSYVLRCLRNRVIDLRRTKRSRPQSLDGLQVALFEDDGAVPQIREEIQRARVALAKIADGPREVIVLKIFGELTFQEISDVLSRPLGTVTAHYARGLAELRRELEEVPDVSH